MIISNSKDNINLNFILTSLEILLIRKEPVIILIVVSSTIDILYIIIADIFFISKNYGIGKICRNFLKKK